MKVHAMRSGYTLLCASLAVALAMPAALAGAGRTDPPGAKTANRPGAVRPVATGTRTGLTGSPMTSIIGAAWDVDNSPIEFANLRLRNVINGKVEALARADETGQFTFENVPAGSYVVELVDAGGRIETMGHVFTIAHGETVATFVRLPAKVPTWTSFFSNTAGAAALAAASLGVTAIAPLPLCTSPPCDN